MKTNLGECIKSGLHLTDCDDDGYCNHCGHQEGGIYEPQPRTKKDIIKAIKEAIKLYGEFTTADVIADYSPSISSEKGLHRLCESFDKDEVEVVTYDRGDEEIYTDYMKYEQLTNATLLEIYKLSKVWIDMCKD